MTTVIEVTPWPQNTEVKRKKDHRFDAELISGYIAQCPKAGE